MSDRGGMGSRGGMGNRGGMMMGEGMMRDRGSGGTGGGSAASGINRDDLRDLILDRIRSSGQLDQLLEQIHNRIEGED